MLLADKYEIPGLTRCILVDLESYDRNVHPPPLPDVVKLVYDNTSQQSVLRRLVADWYAWFIDLKWFNTPGAREHLCSNPDFPVDVITAQSKLLVNYLDNERKSLWSKNVLKVIYESHEES